jgi:hypothetical protein
MAIECAHPRPALNMPSGSPARLRWQPPTFIPENLGDLRRFLAEQYRAIYNELMGAQMARAVVPLIDSLIQAQSGQIIQGVGDGQTIVLPAPVPGQLDDVRVVLDDVINPVTVVDPDGNATILSTPGVFDFNSANAQPYGTPPAATALGGGTFVVETADPVNLPAAYEATDSAEIDWTFSSGLVTLAVVNGSLALTRLAPVAAESFVGNFTAGSASPTARAGSSVAGDGLTYTAGGTLAVGSSTSIVVGANDVQRAALTGDVTAAQNVNTTAFRAFTARSVLANATNASAVPTELQGSTAHHLLKVNAAGTALVFEALPLAAFPTIADDTFLANISGGTAVPSAVALTTLAGAGLTGGADAILAVGAGDGIDVNANDVAVDVTDIVDGVSITEVATNNIQRAALTGAIAATAGSNATIFSGFRGNGGNSGARAVLDFLNGTNTTVALTDDGTDLELRVNVDDFPLTGLANQADDTFLANISGGSAPPTAVALSTLAGDGLTGGANAVLAVGGSTSIIVGANDVQRAALTGAVAAGQNGNGTVFSGIRDSGTLESPGRTFLNFVNTTSANLTVTQDAGNDELEISCERAALTGDVTASANSNATTIANDAVTNAKAADMAQGTIKGRALAAGTGDPTDLSAAQAAAIVAPSLASTSNIASGGTLQRAALTGEVTASQNSNALTIDKTISPTWTGTHTFGTATQFTGRVMFNADTTVATTGSINNLAIGNVNVVRFSGAAPSLSGMVPSNNGQLVLLVADNSLQLLNQTLSTASNQFIIPHTSITLDSGEGTFVWYDGTRQKWRLAIPHNSIS